MSRVSLDRLVNDELKVEIFEKLKKIAKDHFNYTDKKFKVELDSPLYSYLKKDATEHYHKI
jgi:hypothetical protein